MIALIVIIKFFFLVIIHELGHFLAAKWMKVHVEEFGIGFPPRLLRFFTKSGTIFSLNWIPLGGFVRLAGDDAETFEKLENGEELGTEEIPKSALFSQASVPRRLVIVLAGAVINILFAMIVFVVMYMALGIPEMLPHPRVDQVQPGSPAETVQLRQGDELLSLGGKEMTSADLFIAELQQYRGKTVEMVVKRDGAERTIEPYIRSTDETPTGEGALGISLQDFEIRRYPLPMMIWKSIQQGWIESWMFSKQILDALRNMVVQSVTKGTVPQELSGPIGIVYMVQRDDLFSYGPWAMLGFLARLSMNLGVVNLLPIPALDGGRAVFAVLELIIGKRRRVSWERYANAVGMVLLLGLAAVISLKDVWMIVGK
jgi:regulator of sigma E protease